MKSLSVSNFKVEFNYCSSLQLFHYLHSSHSSTCFEAYIRIYPFFLVRFDDRNSRLDWCFLFSHVFSFHLFYHFFTRFCPISCAIKIFIPSYVYRSQLQLLINPLTIYLNDLCRQNSHSVIIIWICYVLMNKLEIVHYHFAWKHFFSKKMLML